MSIPTSLVPLWEVCLCLPYEVLTTYLKTDIRSLIKKSLLRYWEPKTGQSLVQQMPGKGE